MNSTAAFHLLLTQVTSVTIFVLVVRIKVYICIYFVNPSTKYISRSVFLISDPLPTDRHPYISSSPNHEVPFISLTICRGSLLLILLPPAPRCHSISLMQVYFQCYFLNLLLVPLLKFLHVRTLIIFIGHNLENHFLLQFQDDMMIVDKVVLQLVATMGLLYNSPTAYNMYCITKFHIYL